MHMDHVCWLDIYTQIDNIPLTEQNSMFDIYIYHGVVSKTSLNKEKVIVKVAEIDSKPHEYKAPNS